MTRFCPLWISSLLAWASTFHSVFAAVIHLNVTNEIGKAVSPLLYGVNLEDVNYEGEGGLYGELLRDPGLLEELYNNGWTAASQSATLSRDGDTPLSSAITHTLKLVVAADATGQTGFCSNGFDSFEHSAFSGFFYVKGAFDGNMTVQTYEPDFDPVSTCGALQVCKSKRVRVNSTSNGWTKVAFRTKNRGRCGPDRAGRWRVLFSAPLVAGRPINFGYPVLFAPKYKGRYVGMNGLRTEAVARLRPKFARFPGGENLLGNSPDTRWKWNETIGPLIIRPGRIGAYGYPNSDGQGLLEWLRYCEDLNAAPILAIWSGAAIRHRKLVGAELQPYVDDSLAELDFILGDVNTPGGRLRASYGRRLPFDLQYVEIGFRDDRYGCRTYPQRLLQFHQAIKQAYPSLNIIASTTDRECLPDPLPQGLMLDYFLAGVDQLVGGPDDLKNASDVFRRFDPAHPILVGAFTARAAEFIDRYPYMLSASAEAAFMLGWERYPEIVKMGAYATLMARTDAAVYRVPTLFEFDGRGIEIRSTSFHVQTLFSHYTGTNLVRVNTRAKQDPVFWSATYRRTGGRNVYFVKLVNYQSIDARINVRLESFETPFCDYGNVHGRTLGYNGYTHPNAIQLNYKRLFSVDGVYLINLRSWEVGVLVCSEPA